jgi:hypothetical protein
MTAKKTTKRNLKPKTTKPATKPSTAAISLERSHGGHKEGSRKGKVHELFDKDGAEAAWVLGLKLQLKQTTLRSWFAAWKRLQSKSKAKVNTNSDTPPAVKPVGLSATSEAAHP